jgi:subfamily B ATP-binding cassette protein MsbA
MPLFGVIVYLQNYLLSFLNNKITADLRTEVFNHLLTLPFTFFSKYKPGTLISRVTSDIMFIQMTLMASTVDLVRQLILLLGGSLLIVLLNWQLALLIIVSAPLILIPIKLFSRRIRHSATEVQDRSAELSSVIEESISGIKEIKSYTHEKSEQQRFGQTIDKRFAVMMHQNRTTSLFLASIVTLTTAILILLMWFGGNEALHQRLLPGDLIAILFYMGIILGPARESAKKYSKLQESAGASKRVFEILDSPQEENNENNQEIDQCDGNISFKNVSFSYQEAKEKVLKNIS